MILFKKKKNQRRKKIIMELEKLYREFPNSRDYISDMILYAEIGKNRMSLPDDWAERTKSQCMSKETSLKAFENEQ